MLFVVSALCCCVLPTVWTTCFFLLFWSARLFSLSFPSLSFCCLSRVCRFGNLIECVMLSTSFLQTLVERLLASKLSLLYHCSLSKCRIPAVVTVVPDCDHLSRNNNTLSAQCTNRDRSYQNNNNYGSYDSRSGFVFPNALSSRPTQISATQASFSLLNLNFCRQFSTLKYSNSETMSGSIEDQIKEQGDIVRALKSKKAEKSKVGHTKIILICVFIYVFLR